MVLYLIVEITVLLDLVEVLLPLFFGSAAVRPGYAMLQPKPSKPEYQPSRSSLMLFGAICCKPTLAMISKISIRIAGSVRLL